MAPAFPGWTEYPELELTQSVNFVIHETNLTITQWATYFADRERKVYC